MIGCPDERPRKTIQTEYYNDLEKRKRKRKRTTGRSLPFKKSYRIIKRLKIKLFET